MLSTLENIMSVQPLDLLKVVTPVNHKEAKEAWLADANTGLFTNPIFKYADRRDEARKATIELNRLEARILEPKSPQEEFIRNLAIELIRKQCLVNTIAVSVATGDESLTNGLLHDYHGRTDQEIIDTAYAIAAGKTVSFPRLEAIIQKLSDEKAESSANKKYDAHDLKRMFEAVLGDYRLNDLWTVEISDDYSAVTVKTFSEDGRNKLFVPTTKTCNEIAAIKLAVHEIESHIRHNMNCVAALKEYFDIPYATACRLVSDRDATLTEGFAKIGDAIIEKKCTGKVTGTPKPWYVIAADLASKGESFAQITERLHTEYKVGLETCWNTVIRIFRGCIFTSNQHHYAREADRCYLEGFLVATKLYEEASPLFDYAKFDQATYDAMKSIVGDKLRYARYPYMNIAENIVNYM